MRNLKRHASRFGALLLSAAMVSTGFAGFMTPKVQVAGNLTNEVEAYADTAVTGTVNADDFSWDNATVYFLLTDRFRNGNTSNDHSYNRGLDANGNVISGIDDRATFHGGDFAGITQAIEEGYFDELGVNALWISAAYEQIHGYLVGGDGSPSFAHYSYHGYYVLDYTQTDANFGTEEEFKTLVDTAHEHGLRVVMDIVMNHVGYNSLYDMNEYGFGTVSDGWDDYYYSMTNVNNSDYHSYIDYDSSATDWAKWWGADWVRSGVAGYTAGGSDELTMCLSGLPDVKTESTSTVDIPAILKTKWNKEGRYSSEVSELKAYLSKYGYAQTPTNCISYWLSTWVREYGVDGFRCDTAKHVDKASWKTLKTMCTEALETWRTNNPDSPGADWDEAFWMTGEAWDHGVGKDAYYTQGGFDSMINFNTNGGGVLASGSLANTYQGYADSINSDSSFNVLSFISSHDEDLADRGNLTYLGSAFLLLPGGVQIYYGDETARGYVSGISKDGNGGAGHSLRSDMNWDSIDEDLLEHWQTVGTFRNNHIAVGAGQNSSATSSSGVAFTRTYSDTSNNISDRVAAVVGATANTNVTIDVSAAWSDGEAVVNYYDQSSAVVTDGCVTFNSGSNGTILIEDSDGRPIVKFNGDSTFKETETVTVSLEGTDSAIVSVDGRKKFTVKDGDTFEIGANTYDGDTVTITYTASNENGTFSGKASFVRNDNYEAQEEEEVVRENDVIRVKMSDGSVPYIYAWTGSGTSATALVGSWPGTKPTQTDSEGYYVMDLGTTDTFNVIFNNGSSQTEDITGLQGTVTFDVNSSFGSYTKTGSTTEEEVDNTITIHVKPYTSTAPYLYVWNSSDKAINGSWPGAQLTSKDSEGWYTYTLEGVASVSCIVNDGGSNQTADITDITGETYITMTSATAFTREDVEDEGSDFEKLKKLTRSVKNIITENYTSTSYKAVYAYVSTADALIAQGEEEADASSVTSVYNSMLAAKDALVVAAPKVTSVESNVITGTAAYDSTVTVVQTRNGGKVGTFTAEADGVTGVYSVKASSVKEGDVLKITAELNGSTGETLTYTVGQTVEEEEDLAVTLTVNGKSSDFTATIGTTLTIKANATGGSGDYTYTVKSYNGTKWFTRLSNSSSNTCVCTPDSDGYLKFVAIVTDSDGNKVESKKLKVTMECGEDLVGIMKINYKKEGFTAETGSLLRIQTKAYGGSEDYTFTYKMYNGKKWTTIKSESADTQYRYYADTAGTYKFVVQVKDSEGNTVDSNKMSIKVEDPDDLTAVLKVNGLTDASTATLGDSVSISAKAVSGSGTYTYTYKVYNGSKWTTLAKNQTSSTYTYTPASAGSYRFVVVITDSDENSVDSNKVDVVVSK